ncbi:glycosyltransferase family 2 protein [Paenibacillus oceani]|uniref:Glycosyltransferase family 2 protein n=1 Tax=Paenibacillus oceani TaxID=2772510 RepID=A0A927H2U2_9BACL|nr:glycosyltransferase family 2 protein [Paenibacillus oceani]MBD2866180.1 glycosyltransferase family 2 protein [Paenibacillus oceani]
MNDVSILVSVVMPIRNEEKYIVNCIETLMKQDYPKKNLEIILVDGCSTDKTKEILNEYQNKHPNLIKVIENPNKTVQYALNIGILAAQGVYIVRLDAHSEYANDYISKCVHYLETTDATNVGGPTIVKGKTELQKVIASSYHSTFGMGGGNHHNEQYEGYSETVFLGAYRKESILRFGLYDENFPRNEDDELNYRIKKNGGKVFVTPQIKSVYFPRNSLKALFKQHFEYGYWKVAVIKKHNKPARITHLVPGAFVVFNIVGLPLSLMFNPIAVFYCMVMLLYFLLNGYYSATNKHISGLFNKITLFLVHIILHVSYGTGFVYGLLNMRRFKFNYSHSLSMKP